MRKRLASYFAVLCFIICSIICGPTSVSAIWTVDDIADQIQDDLDNMDPLDPDPIELPVVQPSGLGEPVVTAIGLANSTCTFVSGSFQWGYGSSSSFSKSQALTAGTSWEFTGDTTVLLGSLTGASKNYARCVASDAVWRFELPDDVAAGSYVMTGSVALKFFVRAGTSGSLLSIPLTNLVLYDSANEKVDTLVLGDDGRFYPSISETKTVSADGPCYLLATMTNSLTSSVTSSSNPFALYASFDDGLTLQAVTPEEPEYNGLLNSIIEWLKSIKAGITGIVDAITSLPGLIVDGIKGLFVPSQDALQSLKGNYETLFEGKFGFIYQLYNWVVTFFGDLKTALTSGAAYAFTFPGIAFPMDGETITILDETAVSLDNSAMTVLRPVLGTAVSFIVVIATVNTCRRFILRFLSGHIFGGGGDEV